MVHPILFSFILGTTVLVAGVVGVMICTALNRFQAAKDAEEAADQLQALAFKPFTIEISDNVREVNSTLHIKLVGGGIIDEQNNSEPV
jgi:hypothetical protein